MVSVSSYAYRALRGLPRYHHCRDEPDHCRAHASWIGEKIVGIYENPHGVIPREIIITEIGLYLSHENDTQFIPFSALKSIRGPEEKGLSGSMYIELEDDTSISLRVEGRDGKHQDVYEMARFLDRVRTMRQKGSNHKI